MTYTLEKIATVESPFTDRFGIPRQPGLVNVRGSLRLEAGFDDPAMFDGLEGFSHLWVTFVFHANAHQGWKTRVKPPRLGGRKQIGVYASRSPFRPNFLGLSVLAIEGIERRHKISRIHVSGLDLLNGTPVVDIKPYVSYSDAISGSRDGFAPEAPKTLQTVVFSRDAEACLQARRHGAEARELITQLLAYDPRPAYQRGKTADRIHGMRLYDFEVRWQVDGNKTTVLTVRPDPAPGAE